MAKEREDYTKPANTFIGKGIKLQAKKLTGAESVRIDGHFVGDIDLDGYLQLGETGRVEGNIHVSYALIAGQVGGGIQCRATVHLASGSVVVGDIVCEKIVIDDGAIIRGFVKTRGAQQESL